MNRRLSIPIACTLALAATAAFAQPEDEPLPSLDELLGLEEKDESAPKHEVDTDAADAELNRELAQDKPIADEFLEAVGLMHESAGRLGTRGDTGVVTQRLRKTSSADSMNSSTAQVSSRAPARRASPSRINKASSNPINSAAKKSSNKTRANPATVRKAPQARTPSSAPRLCSTAHDGAISPRASAKPCSKARATATARSTNP